MDTTILIGAAFLAAFPPLFARTERGAAGLAALGASAVFLLGLITGVTALLGHPGLEAFAWYLDPLSGLLVLLVTFVGWTASLASVSYLGTETAEGVVSLAQVRRYAALSALFVCSMLGVVLSDNLGLMWVALEATTLTTALLVAFYARKGSLEAAWKYLILCSTGIALGLMGVILVYAAVSTTGLSGFSALGFSELLTLAPHLPHSLMRLAFAFVLVGYGTKVGLVPMHAWLPDAHSSAPAPISGMLSGILLSTALFALLRFKALTDLSLGATGYTEGLLLAFGLLTTVVSALFVLVQLDYKRLLAYSSIEHMGLTTFALGLGAPGAIVAVLHLAGHALAKPMLFFGAGNVVLRFKSTKFERVQGVMRVLPRTGGFLLLGLLALLAVPPSPLFMSEYLLAVRALSTHPVAFLFIALALALVLAGFARAFLPFLFARPHAEEPAPGTHAGEGLEKWNSAHTAMALHAVVLVGFGCLLFTGLAAPLVARIAASII